MVDNRPAVDVEVEVEVFPTKMDYETDYKKIVADIQEIMDRPLRDNHQPEGYLQFDIRDSEKTVVIGVLGNHHTVAEFKRFKLGERAL